MLFDNAEVAIVYRSQLHIAAKRQTVAFAENNAETIQKDWGRLPLTETAIDHSISKNVDAQRQSSVPRRAGTRAIGVLDGSALLPWPGGQGAQIVGCYAERLIFKVLYPADIKCG